MKNIPILETSRLVLRGHTIKDFPEVASMWKDPGVTKYTIGSPVSEHRSWLRILNYIGHWQLMGFGYWAVEEKSTHRFIGELGYADYKRDIQAPNFNNGTPEMGWVLITSAQGQGYATEALLAARSWGDQNLPTKLSVCLINENNKVSLKIAQKLGFKETGRITSDGNPDILFERRR